MLEQAQRPTNFDSLHTITVIFPSCKSRTLLPMPINIRANVYVNSILNFKSISKWIRLFTLGRYVYVCSFFSFLFAVHISHPEIEIHCTDFTISVEIYSRWICNQAQWFEWFAPQVRFYTVLFELHLCGIEFMVNTQLTFSFSRALDRCWHLY